MLFLLWSAILLSLFAVFVAVNTGIHPERNVACFALVFRRCHALAEWPLKLQFVRMEQLENVRTDIDEIW